MGARIKAKEVCGAGAGALQKEQLMSVGAAILGAQMVRQRRPQAGATQPSAAQAALQQRC